MQVRRGQRARGVTRTPSACARSSSTGNREACDQAPLPATWQQQQQQLLLRLLSLLGPSLSTPVVGLGQGARAGRSRRACERGAARRRRRAGAAAMAPVTAGAAAWPRSPHTGPLQGAGALTRARPLRCSSSSCYTPPALPRCCRGRVSSPSAAAAACWSPILPPLTAALASEGRALEGLPGRGLVLGVRRGRSSHAPTARSPSTPTLPAPGPPAGPLALALPPLPGRPRTCLRCEGPPA
jgi:hypothetical protein